MFYNFKTNIMITHICCSSNSAVFNIDLMLLDEIWPYGLLKKNVLIMPKNVTRLLVEPSTKETTPLGIFGPYSLAGKNAIFPDKRGSIEAGPRIWIQDFCLITWIWISQP